MNTYIHTSFFYQFINYLILDLSIKQLCEEYYNAIRSPYIRNYCKAVR